MITQGHILIILIGIIIFITINNNLEPFKNKFYNSKLKINDLQDLISMRDSKET